VCIVTSGHYVHQVLMLPNIGDHRVSRQSHTKENTPRYGNSLKNTGIPVKLRPILYSAFLCSQRCLSGILWTLPRSSNWCDGLMVLAAGKTTLGRATGGLCH
jgi:hypothetical protein